MDKVQKKKTVSESHTIVKTVNMALIIIIIIIIIIIMFIIVH